MNNNTFNHDELYHHGVKGMKWGVRRNRNTGGSDTSSSGKKRYTTAGDVAAAKKKMKTADKAYNKSFNKAYRDTNIFTTTLGPKKLRDRNDRLWEDAGEKAEKYREARKDYKMLKKSYKQAVKEESKRILEGESFVSRMYDGLTGAHKTQAKLNIELQDYDD